MQVTMQGLSDILDMFDDGRPSELPCVDVVDCNGNVLCVLSPIDSNNTD